MKKTENKIKKPIIFLTFSFMTCLTAIQQLKEQFHFNDDLKHAFNKGGSAATYAKYAYFIALVIGSFLTVFLIKTLWNTLIPRITNWNKIDYWDAMGIISIILLISYI